MIIGGVGGSGSRALTRAVMDLRWFMAANHNNAHDALDVVDFDYRWTPVYLNGEPDVATMRREFDEEVLPKLLPDGRWGWKHNPSVHLLAFYAERFPDLRFIHLIRDGRDIAVAKTGARAHAMRLGQALLDGDPTPVTTDYPGWRGRPFTTASGEPEGSPERLAALWATTNRQAADLGERLLGNRYLRVRLEDLIDRPRDGIRLIADFLGMTDIPPEAEKVFERPPSAGAWKGKDVTTAVEKMRDELDRFGYLD